MSDQRSYPSDETTESLDYDVELYDRLHTAHIRNASNARRIAELLESKGDLEQSVTWWHHAAELGDKDAIDYVREILNG